MSYIRYIATVFSITTVVLLACVASEQKVDAPPPVRVDATVTEADPPSLLADDADLDGPLDSVQSNIRPMTRDEWEATANIATDTGQPLRRAPVHVVHFAQPALPTPVLDQRKRDCIAYPLTAGFARVRYNLLLQPNLYAVTIRNWSDPKWRETFRVENGWFPVALWRIRGRVAAFWRYVWVQAGPGLPTGNPQVALSADFFRGGDVLCVEALRWGGPVFIAYDQQTGLIVQPQLSQIQNASNDSTPMPGTWTTIGGEVGR